jgi:hypothetical protein
MRERGRLALMDDAHPSELAGAALSSQREAKCAARAWVEHRSTKISQAISVLLLFVFTI